MSFTRRVIRVALPALIVAGCGSDESSPFFPSEGAGQVPTPVNLSPITATNAGDAVRESYLAAANSMGLLEVAVEVGQNLGGGVAKPSGPSVNAGGIAELVFMAPFGPTVYNCTNGGTVTISGDVASPTELSVGDTVNLLYEACDGGLDVVNGAVDTTVEQYSQDPVLAENFLLGLSMDISNYQVTTNGNTETTNGDSGVVVDTLNAPATLESSAAGSSTTFDDSNSSTTLTNYATSETFTFTGEVYLFEVDARGTIDSTALDLPVAYSTPQPFSGLPGEFPSSGEMLVTGQSSSVTLVVIDNISVRLDIDIDGDGEVDDSIETTWTEISSD